MAPTPSFQRNIRVQNIFQVGIGVTQYRGCHQRLPQRVKCILALIYPLKVHILASKFSQRSTFAFNILTIVILLYLETCVVQTSSEEQARQLQRISLHTLHTILLTMYPK